MKVLPKKMKSHSKIVIVSEYTFLINSQSCLDIFFSIEQLSPDDQSLIDLEDENTCSTIRNHYMHKIEKSPLKKGFYTAKYLNLLENIKSSK